MCLFFCLLCFRYKPVPFAFVVAFHSNLFENIFNSFRIFLFFRYERFQLNLLKQTIIIQRQCQQHQPLRVVDRSRHAFDATAKRLTTGTNGDVEIADGVKIQQLLQLLLQLLHSQTTRSRCNGAETYSTNDRGWGNCRRCNKWIKFEACIFTALRWMIKVQCQNGFLFLISLFTEVGIYRVTETPHRSIYLW